MLRNAIIFGVTGQDGHYLTKLLLEKGFYVIGVKRRSSTNNTYRIADFLNDEKFKLVEGDVSDPHSVNNIISLAIGKERHSSAIPKLFIYNLAAQSHVHTSFEQPSYTFDVNTKGVLNILENIRTLKPFVDVRFYQASTSEMFGSNVSHTAGMHEYHTDISEIKDRKYVGVELTQCYQNENTPFSPMSPYAVSKVAAHQLVNNYRKAYGLHASSGILFNHESYLRGDNFVTKKITNFLRDFKYAQGIKSELPTLQLGNLSAYRDFGYAGDYVEAMYLMTQQDSPDDYVIATGQTCTIFDFLIRAIELYELDRKLVAEYIVISETCKRPSEVDYLRGNAEKARKKLGWKPKVSREELIRKMLHAEY